MTALMLWLAAGIAARADRHRKPLPWVIRGGVMMAVGAILAAIMLVAASGEAPVMSTSIRGNRSSGAKEMECLEPSFRRSFTLR